MHMKTLLIGVTLLCLSSSVYTNEYTVRLFNRANKLFIITLDGFRWQEVFSGADSALVFSTGADASRALYWDASKEERRKKLLPFFWNIVALQGEVYGNRHLGSYMNTANPYALSYPGYNELFTGAVDLTLFNNGKAINPNPSVLEQLAGTATYKNKVAAFASWDAFPYILNEEKSKVFINSGFTRLPGTNLSATEAMINAAQAGMEDPKNTRHDELTFLACKEYIQRQQPSVVFLGFGGTDEAAHQKEYHNYLQQANNADRMIGELWQYLQSLPEYSGKTTFIITTDHGRGASAGNWHKHGMMVTGSSQTWMAMLGPAVPAQGERKGGHQLYLKDVKEKMLKVLAQPE